MTVRRGAGRLALVRQRIEARRRPPQPVDLLIVHNPASTRFTPEEVRAAANEAFGRRGLRHRLVTLSGHDMERAVRRQVARAVREGCTRMVAAGGDGTVGLVAQCLARRRGANPPVSLGIIPAGTTNLLARELGIPMALDEAFAVIAEAEHAIELDAILVGKRYVLTQVGFGPDALMIRDTSREKQERLGRVAYMVTFIRRAFRFRPRWFTLKFDGQVVHERAWQLIVANVGSVGAPPFTWGPRIDPTDGMVDLCVLNVVRKRDFGKLVWRLLTSRHRRDENTKFYRVRDRLTVDADRPVLVQGDGEIVGKTPVSLRVVPSALRVLVARDVQGTLPRDAPAGSGADLGTPAEQAAADQKAAAAETTPRSVPDDAGRMMAQRSRTWALQGPLRHPVAALEAYDAALFLRLNTMSLGAPVDRALELVSRFIHYGEGWAAVVLGIVLVDLHRGLAAAVEVLPALWAAMLTVNLLLKRVFRRRRPFIAFVKARVIGPRPRDFSFPSGHAAAGFAGAILLSMHLPAWSPLFYLFALAVSFSRIYLGVHYPSDVVMGAFAGTALAILDHALIRFLLGRP